MQILNVQSLNFNFRLTAAFIFKIWSALGYSRKKIQKGGWGLRTGNSPEILKKEQVKIPEVNLKKWNFQQ